MYLVQQIHVLDSFGRIYILYVYIYDQIREAPTIPPENIFVIHRGCTIIYNQWEVCTNLLISIFPGKLRHETWWKWFCHTRLGFPWVPLKPCHTSFLNVSLVTQRALYQKVCWFDGLSFKYAFTTKRRLGPEFPVSARKRSGRYMVSYIASVATKQRLFWIW